MADFERRQLGIGLEFMRWNFAERNNSSEGSSETKKDAQVIRVWGQQPHEFLGAVASFPLPVCYACPIYIYIYNMCFHASTTTLNLYANLYHAKTKWLLFETKDIFQKCNSTIKTLLGLKTAAKDI